MLYVPFQGLYKETAEKIEFSAFVFLNFVPRLTGLLLLIRLFTLFHFESFRFLFQIFGAVGMFLGFWNALRQTQIKNILAYESVGTLGLLLLSFGQSYLNFFPSIIFLFLISSLSLLIFMSTLLRVQSFGLKVTTLHELSFVRAQSPAAAFLLGASFLSLIHMSPFPGFISFLLLIKDWIAEEAYGTLFLALFFKILSWGCGLKVLKVLLESPSLTNFEKRRRLKYRHVSSFIIGTLFFLLFFLVFKPDGSINLLSLARTTLQWSEDLGALM
ncbi:hypothetical protein AGMMS50296_3640 [Alphaproteobacteria bacterium]|nr:hypothetical protein AGMMS50296_3640 [Alphaproteobacteria bacterium]